MDINIRDKKLIAKVRDCDNLKEVPLYSTYQALKFIELFNDYKPDTLLYFIDFGRIYKIGITSRTIEQRFSSYKLKYKVLDTEFLEKKHALYLEKKLLGLVDTPFYGKHNKVFKDLGGWTETFRPTKAQSFSELILAQRSL